MNTPFVLHISNGPNHWGLSMPALQYNVLPTPAQSKQRASKNVELFTAHCEEGIKNAELFTAHCEGGVGRGWCPPPPPQLTNQIDCSSAVKRN